MNLILEIEAVRSHGRVWKYKGVAKVNGKKMAEAEWAATIVDRTKLNYDSSQSSIIDKNAKISKTAKIGPYTIIGPNVEIGDECRDTFYM